MSDYYWRLTLPNETHISYVTQVKYSTHGKDSKRFQVKSTNLNLNLTESRTWLPKYYFDHFNRFLFRFNLCIRIWHAYGRKKTKAVTKRLPLLLRIMCHLDNVGECIIRPSLKVSKDAIQDWRCPSFEEYLITEFLLGRHDTKAVHDFRVMTKTNIERIALEGLDWDEYKSKRIDAMLEGSRYSYDIDKVPEKDLQTLWDQLEEHHHRALDPYWITKWLNSNKAESDERNEGSDTGGGADGEEPLDDREEESTDEGGSPDQAEGNDEDEVEVEKNGEDTEMGADEGNVEGKQDIKEVDGAQKIQQTKGKGEGSSLWEKVTSWKIGAEKGLMDLVATGTEASMTGLESNATTPMQNVPVVGGKRGRPQDECDAGEEDARKKRSVTPAPIVPVAQALTGFDATLLLDPTPNDVELPMAQMVSSARATLSIADDPHNIQTYSPLESNMDIDMHTEPMPIAEDLCNVQEYSNFAPLKINTDTDMHTESIANDLRNNRGGNNPESSTNVVQASLPVMRPRGRPRGSTKRARNIRNERKGTEERVIQMDPTHQSVGDNLEGAADVVSTLTPVTRAQGRPIGSAKSKKDMPNQTKSTRESGSDRPEDSTNVAQTRTRGRPRGTGEKGKGKQKERSPSTFIHTQVLRSPSSAPNTYESVRVIISPHEEPSTTASLQWPLESGGSHDSNRGTQWELKNVTPATLDDINEDASSILIGLVETVHSLAEECRDNVEDVDTKLIQFLSELKVSHSVNGISNAVKESKQPFKRFVNDTKKLGVYLQSMEKDGKHVNNRSKKGFMILAHECGLVED